MNAQPLTRATEKANQSEVPLIKGQTVRLQDDLELIKKRKLPMMFFLSLNVAVHLRYLRFTHRECAISFLPPESYGVLERSRNPTRRIRFHLTDCFRDCFVLPQFREDVNMVAGAVDNQRDSVFAANRSAKVSMNTRPDHGSQPWLTALGRKNDVIEQVAVGGTHLGGPFRRPSSGAASSLDNTPAVPLRSTPGFSPAHPLGAWKEIDTCSV